MAASALAKCLSFTLVFYVMGKAMSGELSCSCEQVLLSPLYRCTGRVFALLPALMAALTLAKYKSFTLLKVFVIGKVLSGEISCTQTGFVSLLVGVHSNERNGSVRRTFCHRSHLRRVNLS